MVQISFSKKFIDKIGIDTFAKEYHRPFLHSIWMYLTDSRTRTLVNLQRWLARQQKEAAEDHGMQQFAKKFVHEDPDVLVVAILRWIYHNIEYTVDQKKYDTVEKWQTAVETYRLRTGDCEDGAIFLMTAAQMCGVSVHQLQLTCGNVTQSWGKQGHAWVTYLAACDGVPRILDWCYFYASSPITSRPSVKDMTKYDDPWFRVNAERYYGRYRNG